MGHSKDSLRENKYGIKKSKETNGNERIITEINKVYRNSVHKYICTLKG